MVRRRDMLWTHILVRHISLQSDVTHRTCPCCMTKATAGHPKLGFVAASVAYSRFVGTAVSLAVVGAQIGSQ